MDSLTVSSTGELSKGTLQQREQQDSQHSSSDGSNKENGSNVNEESNNNVENESIFVVDTKVTEKFVIGPKVTAFVRTSPIFSASRKIANRVSNMRSMDLIDKVIRKGNGKNGLAVETPLKLGDNLVLVMIVVNYQQQLKGTVYDRVKGTVTCSEKALSKICKDASGIASLDSNEVKIIDDLLAKYLETLDWGAEPTKSAEGE